MMLQKPFVSLLAAFAAVGSVATAATAKSVPVKSDPVARGVDPTYPPPPLPTVNQCNTGPVSCCNTFTSTSNPLTALLSGLLPIGAFIDPNLGVGLGCIPIISAVQCVNQPVCCNNFSQSGLINIGCTPINLGL